jgi:hypothetical protein
MKRSSGLEDSAADCRQYSGMRKSMAVASTVTGQETLAVWRPAALEADQSVETLIWSAYQYQAPPSLRSGSNRVLFRMPCSAGQTPVTSVVWLGYVTVGKTPTTPSA